MSRLATLLSLSLLMGFGPGIRAQAPDEPKGGAESKSPAETKVRKTDEEWRKILTPKQFMVTRQKQTEAAFTGTYSRGHYKGTFLCVCCQAELFTSRTKFESGTGWPSFWQPIRKDAIATQWDYSEAQPRMEVTCRRCDAHLGHVFDDGPAPTGLRYCMNSVALKYRPAPDAKASTSKSKAKSKTQGKSATEGS